jgi:uncharacterized protein (TIGR02598 family)
MEGPIHLLKRRHARGFTLVETALALLVAAVGLMAVIGLFPFATAQGKRSMDSTYAAFLVDSAFASYRAAAESTNLTWSQVQNYEAIAPVTISTPSPGTDVFWKNSQDLSFKADGQVHKAVFIAASTSAKWANKGSPPIPASWEQYDHALRYRLAWRELSPRRRALTMHVWPGEFGPTDDGRAQVFYTEIFNHGF